MKETFYFSHDFGARNDPKIQKLLMKHKQAGIGCYWCLIEMLYEQGGELLLSEIESYAFALHVNSNLITSIINDFNLFEKNEQYFWSNSAKRRIGKRTDIVEKRKQAASMRWNTTQSSISNANALQTESTSNAIKVKESKVKEISLSCIKEEPNAEKERIFEIFFFEKGIINPEKEIERFWAHYEKTGWKDANGNEIVSKCAAALNWKTKEVTGINADFMNRWKKVHAEMSVKFWNECKCMIYGLKSVKITGQSITLTSTKDLFDLVENSVGETQIIIPIIQKMFPGYNFSWNVLKN